MIDANLNRLKEGIRVIEDIARYAYNNKSLAFQLKTLRHQSRIDDLRSLLQGRNSIDDVLRPTTPSELNRIDIDTVITANFKRAQESARVLEELYKLIDATLSENFKTLRYTLYALEKESYFSSK
ncbi:MAG: thiamine-phosphate pyrophosphorylase [Sulfuricurvum sp. PC08-66]|nr:MAG: thiamine-phosphate pyrophosphorylase [Sulfuricurvum sp. PC08-66]